MLPTNLINIDRVSCQAEANSKKRVLELLGDLLAGAIPGVTQDLVFDRLLERERLGSTGLGKGIALPHTRMQEATQAVGAFVQLRKGVDFDAVDNEPVDLAFALVVPESATDEHLQLLANLAAMFSDEQMCTELRSTESQDMILEKIIHWRSSS